MALKFFRDSNLTIKTSTAKFQTHCIHQTKPIDHNRATYFRFLETTLEYHGSGYSRERTSFELFLEGNVIIS